MIHSTYQYQLYRLEDCNKVIDCFYATQFSTSLGEDALNAQKELIQQPS